MGLVPVTVSATSLSFGSVALGGTSVIKNLTVTNNQAAPISLSGVLGGTNSGAIAESCGSDDGMKKAAYPSA
jgi:hypothetical protein